MSTKIITPLILSLALSASAHAEPPAPPQSPTAEALPPQTVGPPPAAVQGGGEEDSAPEKARDVERPMADPEATRARAAAALDSLADEPGLRELEAAALRYGEADPEPVSRLKRAPNRAALLPVLKLGLDHGLKRDESLDRSFVDEDEWGAKTDRDLGLSITTEWRLGELVFSPNEVRVHGVLSDRADRREEILSALVAYYFERKRLLVQRELAPPDTEMGLATLSLRIEELTATIDSLTGGYLSRRLHDDPRQASGTR